MTSLATCLRRMGKLMSQEDIAAIREIMDEGVAAPDAVEEYLTVLNADRAELTGRILEAAGVTREDLYSRAAQPPLGRAAKPNPLGFFSGLARAAAQLKQAKGDPIQMLRAMQKQGGVKREELYWTGLEEFLRTKETITKEEIQAFIDDNGVQVIEIPLGGMEASRADVESAFDEGVIGVRDLRVSGMSEDQIIRYKAGGEDQLTFADLTEGQIAALSRRLKELTKDFAGPDYDPSVEWHAREEVYDDQQELVEDAYQQTVRDVKSGDTYTVIIDEDAGNVSVQRDEDEQWVDVSAPINNQNRSDAQRAIEMDLTVRYRMQTGHTKYDSQQLPGGTNYRELVLVLPNPVSGESMDVAYERILTEWRKFTIEEMETVNEIIKAVNPAYEEVIEDFEFGRPESAMTFLLNKAPGDLPNVVKVLRSRESDAEFSTARHKYFTDSMERYSNMLGTRFDTFEGQHFDDYENVLAWIRVNDRVGPNGERLMHIEEIQSDWHQKGRDPDVGYKTPEVLAASQKGLDETRGAVEDAWVEVEEVVKDWVRAGAFGFTKKPEQLGFLRIEEGTEQQDMPKYWFALPNGETSAIGSTEIPGWGVSVEGARENAFDQNYYLEIGQLVNHAQLYIKATENWSEGLTFNERGLAFGLTAEMVMTDEEIENIAVWKKADAAHRVNKLINTAARRGVPDAPFKGSAWIELALKRALRVGIEGGYDGITWTTGEQQADRYTLSNYGVAKLVWKPLDNEGGQLTAFDKDGARMHNQSWTKKKLPEVIGKELTERILAKVEAGEEGVLTDEAGEFVVGGHGMREFYDRIVPKTIAKLARKIDKKVELADTTIGAAGTDQYRIVSPMEQPDGPGQYWQVRDGRDRVMREFENGAEAQDFVTSLSRTAGQVPRSSPNNAYGLRRHHETARHAEYWEIVGPEGVVADYLDHNAALDALDEANMQARIGGSTHEVHGMRITNALAETILVKGLPLFARKPRAEAAPPEPVVRQAELQLALAPAIRELVGEVEVHIVQSTNEIEGRPVPTDVEGVFRPDQPNEFWLVADNMASAAEAKKKFAHEGFGHLAMERIPEFKEVLASVRNLLGLRNRTFRTYREKVSRRQRNLSEINESKEIIALMVEDGVENGTIANAYAATRNTLRRWGLLQGVMYSEAEIKALTVRAARDLRNDAAAKQAALSQMPAQEQVLSDPKAVESALNLAITEVYAKADMVDLTHTLFAELNAIGDMADPVQQARAKELRQILYMHRIAPTDDFKDEIDPSALYSRAPQEESEQFKRWFGESKVVDDDGDPLTVYHGSTHSFDNFALGRGSFDAHYGRAYYFTDSQEDVSENYAGVGPDLTQRIELHTERIIDDIRYGDQKYAEAVIVGSGQPEAELDELLDADRELILESMTEEDLEAVAKVIATEELSGGSPNIMPVYLKMENPWDTLDGEFEYVVNMEYYEEIAKEEIDRTYYEESDGTLSDEGEDRYREAIWDRSMEAYYEDYNPEVDGNGAEFLNALVFASYDYDDIDGTAVRTAFLEHFGGIPEELHGTSLRDIDAWMRADESIMYTSHRDTGELAAGDYIREVIERAGFDGIIMDASRMFGPKSRREQYMAMDYNTRHYIAFQPGTIKSAMGNRGTYDPNDPNILYSRVRGSDTIESIRAKVLSPALEDITIKDRFRALWERMRNTNLLQIKQGMLDSAASMEAIEKGLYGRVLDASTSAYKSILATKNLGSVMSAIVHRGIPQLRNGVFMPVAGRKGPMEFFEPLTHHTDGNLMPLWELYAVAYRSNRLIQEENRDGTSKEKILTQDEIDQALALSEQYPIFEEVRREWQKFNAQLLDLAIKTGFLSAEEVKIWAKNDWVPFYRAMEEIEYNGGEGPRVHGEGIANVSPAIRRLQGSEVPVGHVFENMMMNTSHLIDGIYRNHAMQRVVAMTDGIAMHKVEMEDEAIKLQDWQLARALIKSGLIVVSPGATSQREMLADGVRQFKKMSKQQQAHWSTVFRKVAPVGDDIVQVRFEGKVGYFQVDDQLLLRTITAMGAQQYGGIVNWMRFSKRLLTKAVTIDPAFMMANFIRDTLSTAVVVDHGGARQIGQAIKSLKAAWQEDEDAMKMMMAGAGGGGFYDHNPEDVRKMLAQRMPKGEVNAFHNSVLTPRGAWRFWQRVGNASEQANRIAVFKRVVAEGGTVAEAAYQARDVLNFTMHGDYAAMQFLIQTVPFLNARLQGLYRLRRGFGENPVGFAMKGSAIMAATIALLMRNMDDDRYEELPEWDKDTYWHFFVGDEHMRLPKPFEVGALFGMIPERMIRLGTGRDDMDLVSDRIWRMMADTFAFNPWPQMIKPGIEQYSNRNMFTGAPIIGVALEGLEPEAQYDPWTSETMRELAKVFPDIDLLKWAKSPKRLQAMLRGYTGTVGMYALGASDAVVRRVFGHPERPTKAIQDYPVVTRFWRNPEPRTSKYSSELYDMLSEADSLYRTMNSYRQQQRLGEVAGMMKEGRGKLQARAFLRSIATDVSAINKRIRQVSSSKMSPDEKKAAIDKLNRAKLRTMAKAARVSDLF